MSEEVNVELGKPIEPKSYSSSPFWHHQKGWEGRKLKSNVDAVTTWAVMREVTAIHSSICTVMILVIRVMHKQITHVTSKVIA